jgi:hypothetical protein
VSLARPFIAPRADVRPWFASTFETITLELSIVASEQVREDVHDALHLLSAIAADVQESVLHRQRNGLVMSLLET